ncbi:hypothetical protein Bbelb_064760 [Branchiostoma belcheri]|nr:hypothetical protein Bbelb_064760 [Branchiostoma belcheri]
MDEIQLVLITLNPDGTDTKLGNMILVLYKSTKRIRVEIWNTARHGMRKHHDRISVSATKTGSHIGICIRETERITSPSLRWPNGQECAFNLDRIEEKVTGLEKKLGNSYGENENQSQQLEEVENELEHDKEEESEEDVVTQDGPWRVVSKRKH